MLEAVGDGNVPDRAGLLAGALTLETLCRRGTVSLDFLDVVAFLRRLTEGGTTSFRKDSLYRLFDFTKELEDAWAVFRGHCLDCKRDTH